MIVKVRSHTVYQQKDGKYKCEVWYENEMGETVRTTHTHSSKSSVNKFLKDYPDEEYYPVCTLNEFFEYVYMDVLKETAKNTNYIKLVSLFNSQIKPVVGEVKMKDLTGERLSDFLEGIAKKRCVGGVRDCYVLLKKIFKHYCKVKSIENSPMRDIKCPESKIMKSKKKQYTPKEIIRICEVAMSINPETNRPKYMHSNAVKLLFLTDLKIGEALALTWKDIDLKNGTITVNKTSSEINLSEEGKTDYSIRFKPLSDNRTRVIVITPEIHSVLLALRNSNPNAKFVISQRNGDPVSKSYISRVMRECVKEGCG